jgi:hypothetical protein
MDPLCKEFPRLLLLLQPMHQCSHDIFIWPISMDLQHLPESAEHVGMTWWHIWPACRMSPTHAACLGQHGSMEIGAVVQQNDTPCGHVWSLPLDGCMKISLGSIQSMHSPTNCSWFTILGDRESNKLFGSVWLAYASGMPAFNCVTLFPFALMHLICYTA